MAPLTDPTAQTKTPGTGAHRKGSRLIIHIGLALTVLAVGIVGAAYINKTAPKARKLTPVASIPLVQVVRLQPGQQQVVVQAMGSVIPAQQIDLEARISGEIVWTHPDFTVGGILSKGAEVLRIDPQDYQLALTLAQARVVDAESKLRLLEAESEAAREEWSELYGSSAESDREPLPLVVKKPQLEAAKALLAAEKSDLQKARLNLERTKLRAPFNAFVRAKHVDLGSQVSPQDQLAELVGTEVYWIQASISVDRLNWIQIPRSPEQAGSAARIFYRNGYERTGKVIKLLGDLETEGRMARVLVAVQDPLDLKASDNQRPPLLIGEYVRIELEGRQLQGVYRIPRTALRDDNKIWIATDEGKLQIRTIETLWRDAQTVMVRDGLQPNERLIVSDLASPVDGMPVQITE